MPRFHRSFAVALSAAFCLLGSLRVTAQAPARAARPKDHAIFVDGQAQVVPAFADSSKWIHQELWVQTDFDTDHDGKPDRMHVDVFRPYQTETEGLKVPVVMGSSPYYAGTGRPQVNWDVQVELGTVPPPRGKMNNPPFKSPRDTISMALVKEWVPRGFAVVHNEAPGTGLSSGCPTVGDYPEREAPAAVIDWLNGRAKGYTTKTGNTEVKATWTTGKVGMMGTSYEGTLPLAAATQAPKGLEVVIPVSPNTTYYHYYRTNGLVRSPGGYLGEDVDVLYDFIASGDTANRARCDSIWKNGIFAGKTGQDRQTGDMNQFWLDRDLLLHVKNIKAAVLLAHGFNDYNVVPEHSLRIYNEMKKDGLPVSIYLHTGGHGGNPPAEMVNRWFSHYLYGVDNGVQKDPPVWIVQDAGMQDPKATRELDSLREYIAAHPQPVDTTAGRGRGRGRGGRGFGGPRLVVMPTPFASFPIPGSVPVVFHPVSGGNGIGSLSFNADTSGVESLFDDVDSSGSMYAMDGQSTHRLIYATAPFTDTVQISGTPKVTLRLALSKPAANLSVWLVMLPYDSGRAGSSSHTGLITRGWADPQNYRSLTHGGNYESTLPGVPLVPGKFYDMTFDLEPDDEFIPAGKQLAVMIMSSDREFTLWPRPGTELMVDLAHSYFTIPIVGGKDWVVKAGGMK